MLAGTSASRARTGRMTRARDTWLYMISEYALRRMSYESIPNAAVNPPCGSRSIISTRRPLSARATPRFITEVDFPTPPFWLAITSVRVMQPKSW